MSEQTDLFDHLRTEEEKNYHYLKGILGETFIVIFHLLKLYDLFFDLSMRPITKLQDLHQIPALLHCIQWLKNEAIAGTITMMRGHVTDSSFYTRRAFEICAVIVKLYHDKDAAKIWMEAGTSEAAGKLFIKTFPAFRLVKETLTPELLGYYEDACLDVHPTFFAVAKRASLEKDYTHRFRYFDINGDGKEIYFIMRFFNLALNHAKVMEFLTTIIYPSGVFDSNKWLDGYLRFVEHWKSCRERWRPSIDQHFADDISSGKSS